MMIHLHPPSGPPIEIEEGELRTLWDRGMISEEYHYWMEGMESPRELWEFFAVQAEALPTATPGQQDEWEEAAAN